jgi:diguanylate cyclase (GGDEF)-like protein
MTPSPDASLISAVDGALAVLDAAGDAADVHNSLARIAQQATAAAGTAVVLTTSAGPRVAAVSGSFPAGEGQRLDLPPPVARQLSPRTNTVRPVVGPLLGFDAVEVWPIVALGRAVAGLAVAGGLVRADAMLTAACRYAGLRLAQLFDTAVREDLLHERGAAIAALRRQADTDPLTGLANRSGVYRILQSLLGRGQRVGAVMLDLNGFKEVNDTHGHQAGDEVLVTIARRLRSFIRAPDAVARLGGDEFVVIVREADEPALRHLAARVEQAVSYPMAIDGVDVRVTASCGIAIAGSGPIGGSGPDAAELLATADRQMYAAKRVRRDRGDGPELIDLSSRTSGQHG